MTDHDEDFHPAKRGDTPIWLGGMKYIREDVAEAMVAAALGEAVEAVRRQHSDPENENGIALAEAAILALITGGKADG